MGVLKFRLTPPDLAETRPDLRLAYITGQDRTPGRLQVELRPGLMTCYRENPESGRLHVAWPVAGFGTPILTTATLADRPEPYDLAVELARGRLNDVRNQAADWKLMGLRTPSEFDRLLSEAQRGFARAATSRDDPAAAAEGARRCLEAACAAGQLLVTSYTAQVLARRREGGHRLPTLLSCGLDAPPKQVPWSEVLPECFNAARVRCPWALLAPDEGKHRWEEPDAQLHWCRKRRLTPTAGPLLDFRPGALPDWLWLWGGDFDEIRAQVVDLVRQAVGRYRGRVAVWHLAARVASGEILGLSEEEQIRLVAKALQVARHIDPNAQYVIDFDRPWAEWMATSSFQFGPLHLADSLARAELGLTGIGLEIAPGYNGPGSHYRDLFEFSRLLDLFALVNLPLHLSLVAPSSAEPDPQADPSVRVEVSQWPA
ncbi:MAG: hypothetical protein IRY99_04690, partial [Isosphaeraceae bacterium]|nr:hypothetical protein [Isosphaeraceae bacterium]